MQVKEGLAIVKQSLVVREKRPKEDLVEDFPPKKKSKTGEDLEYMLQLTTRSPRREQQDEFFRL